MFSYVNQTIRQALEASGRLVYLCDDGSCTEPCGDGRPAISLLGPIPLPVFLEDGEFPFHWYAFVRRLELQHVLDTAASVTDGRSESFRLLLQERMNVNSIIATPDFASLDAPLVRVHSCCMTGDVFGSMRCECGPQLALAFARIAKEGGAVVYMSGHEGRGIGLFAKAITYLLQDGGQDTYQANVSLGLPEDSRDFTDAAIVLRHFLRGRPIRLMSNNPVKIEQLVAGGQPVIEALQHVAGVSDHNTRYLRSKRNKGHNLPEL